MHSLIMSFESDLALAFPTVSSATSKTDRRFRDLFAGIYNVIDGVEIAWRSWYIRQRVCLRCAHSSLTLSL